MKSTKYDQLIQGQTGIAKKVYECVPIQEAWTAQEIAQYMKTRTGSSIDMRVIQGCLTGLVDAGLIRADGRNNYKRIQVEEATKEVLTMKAAQPKKTEVKPAPVAVIDLLGGIASEVLVIAADLSAKLKRVAKSIEDAALSVESERENSHESVEKLRQLQALLKSL